jgi:hypothetical protein
MPYDRNLLLKLWDKAVGTDGYDKQQWIDLDNNISRALDDPKKLIESRIFEAAFPQVVSVRDQFAMAALAATENWMQDAIETYPHMAYRIFLMADAMMEARKK